MEAVSDVEGGEDVVEAVAPHVLAHQHQDAHKVSQEAEPAKRWPEWMVLEIFFCVEKFKSRYLLLCISKEQLLLHICFPEQIFQV